MSTKNSEIYQWGIGPSKQDWHNQRCKRPHLYYIRESKKDGKKGKRSCARFFRGVGYIHTYTLFQLELSE